MGLKPLLPPKKAKAELLWEKKCEGLRVCELYRDPSRSKDALRMTDEGEGRIPSIAKFAIDG